MMKFVLASLVAKCALLSYFTFDVACIRLIEYSDDNALMAITRQNSSLFSTIISTTVKPIIRRRRLHRRKSRLKIYQNTTVISLTDAILTTNDTLASTRRSIIRHHPITKRRRRPHKHDTTMSSDVSTVAPRINETLMNISSTESTIHYKPIIKKRRRPHRQKTRPDKYQSTTAVSIPVPTTNQIATRHSQRHRKLKKRRKNIAPSTKSNKENYNKPHLESKNLVLPIIPTQAPSMKPEVTKETRCSTFNGGCSHICHPSGREKCSCFKGFTLAKNHHTCNDINECLINNGNCHMNCTNNIGSFRCHCPRGLRLSTDARSCEDVNECLLRNGHGPCQGSCENTYGSYKCSCARFKGTKLGNDLHSCVDLDECAQDNGGCSHICINTFGRSFCSCPEGMELSGDWKTCQDINECDYESTKRDCPNGCINTEGSYRCASIFDLQNDEAYKEVVCEPLYPPENGYFKCSRKHALKTFTKSGRKRIKNSLGTKCILVCPEGFKRRGRRFRISCGRGGRWMGNMDAKCVPG